MDANSVTALHTRRQRSAVVADQIDIDTRGRKRLRVVLHAGASPKIRKRNDDGSHRGKT